MTQYKADLAPDTTIKDNAGWCLSFTRRVFGAPAGTPDAYHAWLNAKFKHESRELPNVAVPLFFSWINKTKGDPAYGTNQGHACSWIPGRGFLSSPGSGYGQQWFGSLAEVERYFSCTFLGWTEDINGKRVAEPLPNQAPAPVAAPVVTGQGGDYHLAVQVPGFVNAGDAAAHHNATTEVAAGDYKIFNQANGMVNVTHDASQPGSWINPADNHAPAPAPAPAAPAGFKVGDVVVPTNLVDYNGHGVSQFDKTYTITELTGDRAVLSARGQVWAAMRTSSIRHA